MAWADDDRGQIITIEAFIAAIILLVVLAVVVQATSVTPLTTSFTNQHVKYELQSMGQDILTSLDERPYNIGAMLASKTRSDTTPSMLEKSIADWLLGTYYTTTPISTPRAVPADWYTYDGIDKFQSATNPNIYRDHLSESTMLEQALDFTFAESGIAYNIEVRYPDVSGKVYSAKMIWNGDPSDNCVTISRYVALHDAIDSANPGPAEVPSLNCPLIPDISPDTTLHSVVEVRLTIWVM